MERSISGALRVTGCCWNGDDPGVTSAKMGDLFSCGGAVCIRQAAAGDR